MVFKFHSTSVLVVEYNSVQFRKMLKKKDFQFRKKKKYLEEWKKSMPCSVKNRPGYSNCLVVSLQRIKLCNSQVAFAGTVETKMKVTVWVGSPSLLAVCTSSPRTPQKSYCIILWSHWRELWFPNAHLTRKEDRKTGMMFTDLYIKIINHFFHELIFR